MASLTDTRLMVNLSVPRPTAEASGATVNQVYVVDDDAAVRRQIATMMQAAGLPMTSYGAVGDFLADAEGARGCLILDDLLPGATGRQLLHELPQRGVDLPIILISDCSDMADAVEAMKLGAVDFLAKPLRGSALVHSVLRAIELDTQRRARAAMRRDYRQRLARLSQRERQVVEMVVVGQPSKRIAADLGLSIKTVEAYRTTIMGKLQVTNVAEMVRVVTLAMCCG